MSSLCRWEIAHARQANNGPMRLDDLAIRTQTPLDTDKVLFEKFRAHERVEFDIKTNLYSFKVNRSAIDIILMS
jgi:transcription initiation factor TFIIE subunit beta